MAPLKTSTGGSSSAFCCLCQPSLPDRLIATGVFSKDYRKVPSREKYLEMVGKAVKYLFIGFLYKFVLAYLFGQVWLPFVEHQALMYAPHLSWWVVAVAYVYAGDLYFDFAGYSLFAVAISYLMGVETPMNFNKPFVSKNIKEFWNRWHMTLSFWFRDYIFMRFVFLASKKHWFKTATSCHRLPT